MTLVTSSGNHSHWRHWGVGAALAFVGTGGVFLLAKALWCAPSSASNRRNVKLVSERILYQTKGEEGSAGLTEAALKKLFSTSLALGSPASHYLYQSTLRVHNLVPEAHKRAAVRSGAAANTEEASAKRSVEDATFHSDLLWWEARAQYVLSAEALQLPQITLFVSSLLKSSLHAEPTTTTSEKPADALQELCASLQPQIADCMWNHVHEVVSAAVRAIEVGEIHSSGELMYFLCLTETSLWRKKLLGKEVSGQEDREAEGRAQGLILSNGLRHYIREGYLRHVAPCADCIKGAEPASEKTFTDHSSNCEAMLPFYFFQQAMLLERGLLRARRNACIPFDGSDSEHINLLQQLWAAWARTPALRRLPVPVSQTDVEEGETPPRPGDGESIGSEVSPPASEGGGRIAESALDRLEESHTASSISTVDPLPFERVSPQWLWFGFPSKDPVADLRTSTFGLEVLIDFVYKYPEAFTQMMWFNKGTRASCFYPIALTSFRLSTLLVSAACAPSFPSFITVEEGTMNDTVTPICRFFTNQDRPAWHLKHFSLVYDTLWRGALQRLHADLISAHEAINSAGGSAEASSASPAPPLETVVLNAAELAGREGPAVKKSEGGEGCEVLSSRCEKFYRHMMVSQWWTVSGPLPQHQLEGLEWYQKLQAASLESLMELHHLLLLRFHQYWVKERPTGERSRTFLEDVVLPSFFFPPFED